MLRSGFGCALQQHAREYLCLSNGASEKQACGSPFPRELLQGALEGTFWRTPGSLQTPASARLFEKSERIRMHQMPFQWGKRP